MSTRRNILSLSLLTLLMSALLIFQNCGKGGVSEDLPANLQRNDKLNTSAAATGSAAQDQARDLYRRLTGTTPSVTDSVFQDMVSHIESGRRKKAAEAATNVSTFYTIVVRDFAGKMSTREGTTLAPLSDFVATVIGAVRDEVPATDLLTENFYYRTVGITGVNDDVANAIVRTNQHYQNLEDNEVDLVSKLVREDGQKIFAPDGATVVGLEDAAGLLTTRAYMMAQAFAGTNRRVVANTFRTFLCAPIETWASTTNPDSHIGPDIGRFPIEEYNNKCKGCHTGMDGMRPASAYYDFFMEDETVKRGFIKYKHVYARDPDPNTGAPNVVPVDPSEQLVPSKFRRGGATFPAGYKVRNNKWVNYADDGMFGWNTPTAGEGMNELGQMIAFSDGYRYCMVKRVFQSVCKFELSVLDTKIVKKLADDFKYNGYNLRDLFVNVSLRPECLGVD